MSIIDNALRQSMQDQIKKKKLWTNASPTSSFASQKVSLDLTNYSGVDIEVGYNNGADAPINTFECPIGRYVRVVVVGPLSTSSSIYGVSRAAEVDADGITFGDTTSKAFNTSGNGEINNARAIPLNIYGIKNILGG